jgi:uncharacterized LabA/DUF88 family protein
MMSIATAVYVDGYNLYYGRIRNTSFKWIDLLRLFEIVLRDQDPTSDLEHLHYFTAMALGRFSTHGGASVAAQESFLRAHEHLHPRRFLKTLGKHSMDRKGVLLPVFDPGTAYDRSRRTRVWRIEEKQTDVNIALAMYRDAASGRYAQMVICSNDSDVEPVLRAIREDFPQVRLGVVTPRHPPASGGPTGRAVSSSLDNQADWTRAHLLDDELRRALLPPRVQTGRKPITKPAHW